VRQAGGSKEMCLFVYKLNKVMRCDDQLICDAGNGDGVSHTRLTSVLPDESLLLSLWNEVGRGGGEFFGNGRGTLVQHVNSSPTSCSSLAPSRRHVCVAAS
jgi:hypothetical protein